MRQTPEERKRDVDARARQLLIEFDNYEKSVTLISSFEGWVRYNWGASATYAPTLLKFDRFPQCGELRPDFLAAFSTGYRLCGEVLRTFRNAVGSHKDIDQVVAYTCYLHDTAEGGPCGDVLLLVHPHTDNLATAAVAAAAASESEEARPQTAVVVVSYMADARATGEWYDLKWRDQPGNSRFSEPNVVPAGAGKGLNEIIADAQHQAIPLDTSALNIFTRNPLINDDPPPLYTLIVVLLPALNELLTDHERDEAAATGQIKTRVTRDQLASTECVSAISPPARFLQAALDLMLEHGWARRVADSDPPEYAIQWDIRRTQKRELKEVLGQRVARAFVDKLLAQRARAQKRAARGQLKLL